MTDDVTFWYLMALGIAGLLGWLISNATLAYISFIRTTTNNPRHIATLAPSDAALMGTALAVQVMTMLASEIAHESTMDVVATNVKIFGALAFAFLASLGVRPKARKRAFGTDEQSR